jgi:NDP-sugar pyrophosphorylase family protein
MKAVVLAAGVGNRLSGILNDIPKPMVQIGDKPILQHNIEWLRDSGVKDIYINLHHLPDVITGYFGDGLGFGVRITYSQEKDLLGTAGAVRKIATDYWDSTTDEPFLVVYGDNLVSDFDLDRITGYHKTKRGIGTLCLYNKPEEVSKSGVVVLDTKCRIERFVEKPSAGEIVSTLVNTGVYVFVPSINEYIPENRPCDFGKDVFPAVLIAGQALYGLVLNTKMIVIDTPELFKKVITSEVRK